MAASCHFLSLTPKTLSLHQHSTAASSALFSPCSLKPLPKLSLSLFSIKNQTHSIPRFIPKVSILESDLEEGEEEEEYADGTERYSDEPKRFPEDQKVFVGNLPWSTDSAYLAGLFEQVGVVEEADVVLDKTTGRSRGFGFVVMSTPEEAEAAAQQLNGHEIDGRSLRVNCGPPPPKRENSFGGPREGRGGGERRYGDDTSSFGGPRGGRGGGERRYGDDTSSFRGGPRGGGGRYGDDTNKLYVGNLSWDVDNTDLESFFGKQGQVKEARVVTDRDSGQSKGFGFVTYSSRDEANNAIDALDGAEFGGRTIRVNLAEARPPRSF